MTRRSILVVALWCCALLMQSIGLLHGYVHPHGGHAHPASTASGCESGAASSSADAGCADALAPHATDWPQLLFAGHDGGSVGCTLFDQLTHADLLYGLPMPALAFAAPSHPDAIHAAWHHATQATGFLARAPPVIG